MRSNWFDPQFLNRQSPAALVRGAMMLPGANMSPKWVDDTVHFFFQPHGFKSGVDLMAINIQRGRDHGINSYTRTRDACSSQARFAHLFDANGKAKMRPSWDKVINFYNGEDEIDLYVGMLMEEPVPGAVVGPTTMCGIVDQFIALKLGDKHWYENDDMFTSEQLASIKDMTLGNVFCHGFNDEEFTVTHQWPLKLLDQTFAGKPNGRVACSDLKSFDFEPWKPTPTVSVLSSSKKPKYTFLDYNFNNYNNNYFYNNNNYNDHYNDHNFHHDYNFHYNHYNYNNNQHNYDYYHDYNHDYNFHHNFDYNYNDYYHYDYNDDNYNNYQHDYHDYNYNDYYHYHDNNYDNNTKSKFN